MIEIPASEQEKKLVREKAEQLRERLTESAIAAKELVQALQDNYLAIDKTYKQKIGKDFDAILSCFWEITILQSKMRDQKARMVEPAECED